MYIKDDNQWQKDVRDKINLLFKEFHKKYYYNELEKTNPDYQDIDSESLINVLLCNNSL